MRIELLEKLVFLASVLAVVAVGATVGLLSIMPPRSGIPDVAVEAELSTIDWLEDQRVKKHGNRMPGHQEILVQAAPVVQQRPGGAAAGGGNSGDGGGEPTAPPAPSNYFNTGGSNLPPGEVIEGYPWLRKVPGVSYHRPKRMPRILYSKYQSFEDSFELAQQGGGEFVTAAGGEDAYQVNWVDPNSMLARRLGLKDGDKIISVNGNPIGNSVAAGKGLYEQLKNETKFAVMVERQGRRELLSFYVD
jgi:hypothetical protein